MNSSHRSTPFFAFALSSMAIWACTATNGHSSERPAATGALGGSGGTTTFGGRTSGTVDLLEIFDWVMAQGWLGSDATLGQIGFGVEIVSTDGSEARFSITDG
jgi:hypothetical protein